MIHHNDVTKLLTAVLVILAGTANAQPPDSSSESAVVARVQQLFDAMAAHDSAAARALVVPEGRVVAVRANGNISNISLEEFAARLATAKQAYLERMWEPKVLVRGALATVWAEYDFHLDGKFSHCGIDSVQLVNTAGGWKIFGVSYTIETTGCVPIPRGPSVK